MQAEQCRFLGAYNEWMNSRLYAACADMSDDERKADRGAFFGSVHGTLNHLLLADRVWLGRFLGEPSGATRLDTVLYEDFDELHAARTREDARISNWVQTLDEATLAAPMMYSGIVDPSRRRCALWMAVTHFFNHQTHHRGQLTTLLTQIGVEYGVTDMIAMPGVVQAIDDA